MEGSNFYNQEQGFAPTIQPQAQALAPPTSNGNVASGSDRITPPTGTPTLASAKYPTAGDDKFGQRARNWLYREQYRDYQTRFEPIERALIDETLSTKLLDDRLSQITINSDRAFKVSGENANALRERYGAEQSTEQRAVADRQNEYAEAFSTADAKNNARTYDYDRRLDTIFGGNSGGRQALQEV